MREFEIWYENYSDGLYEMRVAERQRPPTTAVRVDPCSTGGLGSALLEPFSVGLADVDAPMEQRGVGVADSTAWQVAGDDAVVIVIQADGHVMVETRPEPPAARNDLCP